MYSQHGWVCKGALEATCSEPCPSRATQSRLSRTMPKWLLAFPKEETPQLSGQPEPGLLTGTAEKCCLLLRGGLLSSSLCLLPLVLVLGITEKSLAPICTLPSGTYGH